MKIGKGLTLLFDLKLANFEDCILGENSKGLTLLFDLNWLIFRRRHFRRE